MDKLPTFEEYCLQNGINPDKATDEHYDEYRAVCKKVSKYFRHMKKSGLSPIGEARKSSKYLQ